MIFIRLLEQNGNIKMVNVTSKTRVAPVKTLSIPRLELSAAALLAKLAKTFLDNTKLKINQVYLFSDSKITLSWLAKHPSNWNVVVANKVSFIQTEIPRARWSYIKSKSNPADLNSRGISVNDLIESDLWWHGPKELRMKNEIEVENVFETNLERRKKSSHTQTVSNRIKREPFEKYLSYQRIIRIYAYTPRFINTTRRKIKRAESQALTAVEIQNATTFAIKRIQHAFFHKEINAISKPNQSNKYVIKQSKIYQLNPFLDEDGLLRVGGRLQNSLTLSDSAKHQIILPQSQFAKK